MCGGSWNVILLLWPPSPLPFHRDHRSECGIKSDFWWRQETGDFQYGFIPVWIGSKIFRPKWSVYAKFFGEKVVLGSSIVETVGSPSGREWTTMAQETWSRGRGRGGAGWQGEAKSYQREAEANDNDKWTTMAQDCWPEGGLTIKTSTESWKRLTVLNWSCILRGNLIFQVFCFLKNMYTNIINKKRIVGQNLSAWIKPKSAILKTLKNSICILYVRLVLFERNKTS